MIGLKASNVPHIIVDRLVVVFLARFVILPPVITKLEIVLAVVWISFLGADFAEGVLVGRFGKENNSAKARDVSGAIGLSTARGARSRRQVITDVLPLVDVGTPLVRNTCATAGFPKALQEFSGGEVVFGFGVSDGTAEQRIDMILRMVAKS